MYKKLAVFVMVLFITALGSAIHHPLYAQGNTTATLLIQQEQQLRAEEVLALVNAARRTNRLAPLVLDQELMEAAAIRAQELPLNNSHTRPDGTNCFTVLRYHNAYKGENIGAGYVDAAAVVDGWMHSPGHRANILNRNFTKLGVGYYYAPNTVYKHYWVQMFLGPDI